MDSDLFALDWDPDDEDRTPDAALAAYRQAQDQRSGGDNQAALASLDRGLEAAELDNRTDAELAVLLGAKAVILADIGRHDEALILFNRVLEVADEDDRRLRVLNALSRVGIALLLAETGDHEEALVALRDVASANSSEEDPLIRAAGVYASACRIRELGELGRFDEARAEWKTLRASHGTDPQRKIRAEVAAGGKTATILFSERKQYRLAIDTADEVMALYRTETDPEIRAAVALTMWARLTAYRRRLQLVTFWRGSQDLIRFIGSEPEPEVVAAIESAPRGKAVLRHARAPTASPAPGSFPNADPAERPSAKVSSCASRSRQLPLLSALRLPLLLQPKVGTSCSAFGRRAPSQPLTRETASRAGQAAIP